MCTSKRTYEIVGSFLNLFPPFEVYSIHLRAEKRFSALNYAYLQFFNLGIGENGSCTNSAYLFCGFEDKIDRTALICYNKIKQYLKKEGLYMKKSKVIIITVVVLLLLSAAFLLVRHGLQKPVFPGTTIDIDYKAAKAEFKLSEAALDTKLPVYRAVKMKIKNSEVEKLLAAFSFENPGKERRSGNTYYTEGEKELVIYSNGSYRYTNNKGNSDFFLTKESAKNDAEKLLEANGLLPDDFSFDGYLISEQSGESSSDITEIGIVFEKRLDNHEVVGPAAKITLTYNKNGLASLEGNNIKYSKIMSAKCDTIESLKAKALSDDALITYGETEMKKVSRIEFTNYEIIYYNGREVNNAKYVQPCLKFIGTAFDDEGNSTSFTSTVPMLK